MKYNDAVLCKSCIKWVDCSKNNNLPMGFCLCEDLFTYTEKLQCHEYVKGTPYTEAEWEMVQ